MDHQMAICHISKTTGPILTKSNNNNISIYIAPWFQVTLFKGADTSKKKIKINKSIKIKINI